MKRFRQSASSKDLKDRGRIILAWGETTGHCHEVVSAVDTRDPAEIDMPAADYFEEPDGRRILLVNRPCVLRHEEHGLIALDPTRPVQVRQGDVLLNPIGDGAWEVIIQREFHPEEVRQVLD